MQENEGEIDAVFRQLGRERLERWIAMADERLAGTPVKWYVTGGNDDPADVLTVLENIDSEHVVNCEGKVVMMDDRYPMANCGYSNPTPWDTPREVEEEVLEQHLEHAVEGIDDFRARSSTSTCRPTTARWTTAPSWTGPRIRPRRW